MPNQLTPNNSIPILNHVQHQGGTTMQGTADEQIGELGHRWVETEKRGDIATHPEEARHGSS
jgi:hypothetical protein